MLVFLCARLIVCLWLCVCLFVCSFVCGYSLFVCLRMFGVMLCYASVMCLGVDVSM